MGCTQLDLAHILVGPVILGGGWIWDLHSVFSKCRWRTERIAVGVHWTDWRSVWGILIDREQMPGEHCPNISCKYHIVPLNYYCWEICWDRNVQLIGELHPPLPSDEVSELLLVWSLNSRIFFAELDWSLWIKILSKVWTKFLIWCPLYYDYENIIRRNIRAQKVWRKRES